MWKQLRPTFVSLFCLTLITGVVYPLLVTGIAKLFFPAQAEGSIVVHEGKAIGSELIAQPFTDAKYFWPRPSAANYNGVAGSGSNLAPSNPALVDAVRERVAKLKAADPSSILPVPVDLVTSSGSGLDPHISTEGANYQIPRVARARNLGVSEVAKFVDVCTEAQTLGVLGEPRVNVLKLNLLLDHPELLAAVQSPTTDRFNGPTLYRWRGFLPDRK